MRSRRNNTFPLPIPELRSLSPPFVQHLIILLISIPFFFISFSVYNSFPPLPLTLSHPFLHPLSHLHSLTLSYTSLSFSFALPTHKSSTLFYYIGNGSPILQCRNRLLRTIPYSIVKETQCQGCNLVCTSCMLCRKDNPSRIYLGSNYRMFYQCFQALHNAKRKII